MSKITIDATIPSDDILAALLTQCLNIKNADPVDNEMFDLIELDRTIKQIREQIEWRNGTVRLTDEGFDVTPGTPDTSLPQ